MGDDAHEQLEVLIERPVAAGRMLGREASGRVVLVEGALPGERVLVRPTRQRRRHAEGIAVEVLEAADTRQVPTCASVAAGCGGCDLAHVAPGAQLPLKRDVVVDALVRLGGLAAPEVRVGESLHGSGHRAGRTTVRAAVDAQGRAGFRRRRSHEVVVAEQCPASHPLVEELIVDGRFDGCSEVVLRAGADTGERLVLASPTAAGVRVPDDVVVVGEDELRSGRRAWIHEVVGDLHWRISAGSFFQTSQVGAEALVRLVGQVGDELAAGDAGHERLVDLYAGVGLFAGALGARWPGPVVAVERADSSVADARHNLATLLGSDGVPGQPPPDGAGERFRVVSSAVERWTPQRAGLVVADPARAGLGDAGVQVIDATGTAELVLVSCDPAALGRDAALLAAAGFSHLWSEVVDLFPDTHHVEVVTRFRR